LAACSACLASGSDAALALLEAALALLAGGRAAVEPPLLAGLPPDLVGLLGILLASTRQTP
jgi:hypothetical protein